jgi:DNA-binding transcriptional regulator LsrR (DeoR family)
VQIAIVYSGDEVTIYRNGQEYSRHTMIAEPHRFDLESVIVIGPRHLGNSDFFAGAVEDARIYDRALTAEQIAASWGRTVHAVYKALKVMRRSLLDCVERRLAAAE